MEQKTPLVLPDNYNPQTYMLAKHTENGVFHESRAGAALAAKLVANGTPLDIDLAEKTLDVVLNCQEHRQDDPHYGNFYWMIEDEVVFDLNAVEFNLEYLIPMMIQYRERLSVEMQARVMDAIRLGLQEIESLDVLVVYSNIAVLDILNTCLGGELLGDERIARRGYQKLVDWMALTDQNGTPFEYNSPTYTSVVIHALKVLADLVKDEDTRIRARTAAARLGLSVALHIHAGTGRWTAPHSRAYHPTVVCELPPEVGLVHDWVAEGALPQWVDTLLTARPEQFQVSETAAVERELGITTYHSRSFALGVSVREAGGQSDVMMAHYHRPGAERAGVFYTRYLLNDKWLGDFYHQTDRTKSRNLIEEGRFCGVQNGPRAIGFYTLGQNPGVITSAKAAFIWTESNRIDEIWVGERRIESLPAEVQPGEVVVVGSGDAWFAIRPLARTDLGRGAPIRLVELEGDLVLEVYNYKGTQKPFWELGWPGAFYKGKPQCGVYLEMAERSVYPDGAAFAREVASGTLKDETEAPFVYAGDRARSWRVEYSRGGQTVGLEVDLNEWKILHRWTEAGELGWPMLESPVAQQNRSGQVVVGDAHLSCGQEAGWLMTCPEKNLYVAGYHGLQPAPLTLEFPEGKVEIDAMGMGTVVWDDGKVRVEAVSLQGTPRITGGELA